MGNLLLLLPTLLLSYTKDVSTPAPGDTGIIYTMPEESAPHEGTWIAMTKELIQGEKVHIIAYDQTEQERILALLKKEQLPLSNIDFNIYPTDDVWIRDNGPIYVKDKYGKLLIEDWGFNGWGQKAAYDHCNGIPSKIAADQQIQKINLNAVMVNEGGSVEIDGKGSNHLRKKSG